MCRMNVVIAAVSSNRSLSGVSRHAANLARCLLLRPEISALHVLVASWEQGYINDAISRSDRRLRIHSVPLQPGTLQRNLWYYRTLPAIAEQLRADLVHLAYPSLIRSEAFHCPTVVTLHDLYPYDIPSNFGFPKVLFNRIVLRQCLKNASAIACVSEATRQRLRAIMPHIWPKAVTICNCAESGPPPRKPAFAAPWAGQPFLLCVAQHRRNKNVLLALRVFQRALLAGQIVPTMRLVIVGIPGPESARIHRFVKGANLTHSVIFVDGISDAELTWCYRHSELLLAPSIVEGFGLPVLEAQLAGCRVVCSDIPAFREVASPGCRFVSLGPEAEQNFVLAIAETLRTRPPHAVAPSHLSLPAIAVRYMALYRTILARQAAQALARQALQGQHIQHVGHTGSSTAPGISTTVRL
jgi:glycosyltransferase involved in cell wall biosynthesis